MQSICHVDLHSVQPGMFLTNEASRRNVMHFPCSELQCWVKTDNATLCCNGQATLLATSQGMYTGCIPRKGEGLPLLLKYFPFLFELSGEERETIAEPFQKVFWAFIVTSISYYLYLFPVVPLGKAGGALALNQTNQCFFFSAVYYCIFITLFIIILTLCL